MERQRAGQSETGEIKAEKWRQETKTERNREGGRVGAREGKRDTGSYSKRK